MPLNTYNPNYPAIPGINNSFAPAMGGMPQQQDFGMDGMMHQFGMMQPFTNQQALMQPVAPPPRRMQQPIGAGRGVPQQQDQAQQQVGGVRTGNTYQPAGGVAQQDFARVTANNNNVDCDALGMFRR